MLFAYLGGERRSMRRLLKWGCLGTVTFVGLIVVVAGVAWVMAPPAPGPSGDGSEADQPSEAPRQQEKPQEPQGPEDYLKVLGTPGIPFSCSVMDGNGQQRTVDGKTPMQIKLKDMGWAATSYNSCQKTGAEGLLRVSLVIDGQTEASNQTKAEFGVVTLDYPQ
jgi:hypothetical protein